MRIRAYSRSVYVGNVEYSSTAGDLEGLFSTCGAVRRVTIPLNSHDRHPKGFAYVEFDSYAAVEAAIALDDSLFKGRQIKVRATYSLWTHCILFV